jgi:hypothetical protein
MPYPASEAAEIKSIQLIYSFYFFCYDCLNIHQLNLITSPVQYIKNIEKIAMHAPAEC